MMNQTFNRHRRLRANAAMRDLVKETRLHPSDFIYPLFVVEGLEGKKEVPLYKVLWRNQSIKKATQEVEADM